MCKEELMSAIEAEKENLIQFLQSVLQVPSPNPPGNTTASARVVSNYLSRYSISSTVISPLENALNVVSHFIVDRSTSGPTLIMNGHLDVFPVSDAADWLHNPWGGEIDQGRIYGRGVVDMKAGTAATVAAYTYLHRFRDRLPYGTCVLEAVSDEETGGQWGSRYLLDQDDQKHLWKGDVVLNAEPSGLQSIRFAEKGTLRMTFTVKTVGGHGAYTHLDEGAIRVASRLIQRLVSEVESFDDFTVDPEIAAHLSKPEVHDTVDEIMGKGAAENIVKPTLSIGTINGGNKVNTIPNLCVFEVDIRLPIGLTQEPLLALIDSIISNDFPQASYEIQQAASNPPNFCSPSHTLAKANADNAEHVLERRPVRIPSMGATDVKFWRYKGVPGYSFGVSPEGMAGVDESVALEDHLSLVKILAGAAWDFLGGKA